MSDWQPGQPLYQRRSVYFRQLFEILPLPSDEPDFWRDPETPATDAAKWPEPFPHHDLDMFERQVETLRRLASGQ